MTDSIFKFQILWKPFLIASALAFVYATVLAKLGADWWTDENYSHGLLVPFVIGYIIWLEFDELKKLAKNPSGLDRINDNPVFAARAVGRNSWARNFLRSGFHSF